MRRITVAVLSTISALVLLLGFHTSTSAAQATGSSQVGAATPGPTASSGSSPTTASSSSSSAASGSGTYTGAAVDTRWGTVQVRITVADGKVTSAAAVQYPQGNGRDQEINAYAIPQLNHEAVGAQSGTIDAVSGATVTSDGYIQSLQSAIDQAHL